MPQTPLPHISTGTVAEPMNSDAASTPAGLPSGWIKTSLSQIVEIVRGISFPTDSKRYTYENGYVACLRTTNVQREVDLSSLWFVPRKFVKNKHQIVRLYDILISTANSFELVGKVAQVKVLQMEATLGAFISLIRPDDEVDPKFVYYQLSSSATQEAIRSFASTTTNISNVSTSKLADLSFDIAPLPEQHRIVAEIERQFSLLDAGVANLKRVQATLKRYRASVLQAACEGRLVPTEAALAQEEGRDYEPAAVLLTRILAERRARWEAEQLAKMEAQGKLALNGAWMAKYQEPAAPNTSGLPEVPAGWVWASIGQITWSVKDGPHFSPKYVKDGVPFISGGNIRPNGVDFTTAKYISQELHEELSKRCKPNLGDILYTKGGTTGIARVNTYNHEFSVWVHVAVLKLSKVVEAFYVQHALNSPFCYMQAQKYTHGVGNQDLGLTRMINIIMGLPPLAEQERIVAEVERRLSVVDNLEQVVKANLKRAERLRQAVLKEAFAGRLVPQDPDDEPASVLLRRIKTERIAASHTPKPKRSTMKQVNGAKSEKDLLNLFSNLSAEQEAASAIH